MNPNGISSLNTLKHVSHFLSLVFIREIVALSGKRVKSFRWFPFNIYIWDGLP